MRIPIWNEDNFIQILNSGPYEDLISKVELWAEQNYIISREKVSDGRIYETARRYAALRMIAVEGRKIWQCDSSGCCSSYSKR